MDRDCLHVPVAGAMRDLIGAEWGGPQGGGSGAGKESSDRLRDVGTSEMITWGPRHMCLRELILICAPHATTDMCTML